MGKISKEKLIKELHKLEKKVDVESPISERRNDSKFDEFLRVFVEEKKAFPLSEDTVEILHEVLQPMEISKSLYRRLLDTMLKAEREGQVERKIQEFFSEESFGSYVTTLRKKRGLSMREIASRLQVDPELLEGIEEGKVLPPKLGVGKLLQLATVVRAPLIDFVQIVKKTVRMSMEKGDASASVLARLDTRELKNKQKEALLNAMETMLRNYKKEMEDFLKELEREAPSFENNNPDER